MVGLIVVTSVLGAGAIGCGSGHDSTSGESSTDAASTPATGTVAAQPNTGAEKPHSSQQTQTRESQGASDKSGNSSSTDAPQTGKQATPAHTRALGHRAAKDCPAGLSAVQCGALVEAYGQTKGDDAKPLNDPGDCRKVMSQADCEATLTAQKEAAEAAGTPVNVDECIQNPTPRCEEVLRPMFEEQRAASQAAGK